jgi:hypothetical protein
MDHNMYEYSLIFMPAGQPQWKYVVEARQGSRERVGSAIGLSAMEMIKSTQSLATQVWKFPINVILFGLNRKSKPKTTERMNPVAG